MKDEIEAAEAVSRAIDRVKRIGAGAELTLSNGIILTVCSVPPHLVIAVQNEFKTPDPPKVYIEEKGRDEENPNDPAYLREVTDIYQRQVLAVNDLYLALGTKVKFVPESKFKPEDDGWIKHVRFASELVGVKIEISENDEIKRYLHWLRFYACETGMDIALAQGIPAQLAGIQESEVDEIVESFRSPSQRGANSNGSSEQGSQDGDYENRASRRNRTRNRGA